jgi:filamentous hemagglutinin family protein
MVMKRLSGSRMVPSLFLLCMTIWLCTVPLVTAQAQVQPPANTSITSSGLNTEVSAPTTLSNGKVNYDITGGTRPGGGPNLFHSFGEFSVATNHIANFLNETALPTSNIIGRINGGQVSNIWGTIQTTGFGAANLYLINPSGFIFGPTASLNVGGSFAATTADYFRMTDGAKFYADPVQPSVLSIAPVAAFGFTNPRPVAITVQGSTLAVPIGQSLSMVGGDFTLSSGALQASGGRILIASVASSGEVMPSQLSQPPSLDVSSFAQLGSVTESGGSNLSVSSVTNPAVGAGTILVRADQLTVDGSGINATTGATNGASVGIDLNVTQKILLINSSVQTAASGVGRAGDIRIQTDSLEANNANILGRAISGTGDGGAIDVNARLVNLRNFGGLQTFTLASGRAGNITVRADRLETQDGGRIFSGGLGTGSGGDIDVAVKELYGSAQNLANVPNCAGCFTGIQAQAGFGSRGGSVRVQADSIQLFDGAGILSQLFSIGPGANIDVTAKDILLSGTVTVIGPSGPVTQFAMIGSVLSGSFAQGTGGNITVNAENIEIANNGRIASTLIFGAPGNAGNATINTGTLNIHDRGSVFATSFLGTGNSGNIDITANAINISGVRTTLEPGGVADFTGLSASTATGRGGTIRVTTDDLLVTNKGAIASTTFSSGSAGSINITAADVSVTDAGFITASTGGAGAGGNIEISAERVTVFGEVQVPGALDAGVAAITAQTHTGSGNAGTIKITADQIDVFNKGAINNDTLSTGKGGNIELNADQVTVTAGGKITAASANTGAAGSVVVNAKDVMVAGVANSVDPFVTDFTGFSVKTVTGQGGTLNFVGDNLTISEKGFITSETTGTGNAGSINIQLANALTVTGGSVMSASTSGSGSGGTIGIDAGVLMLADQSRIQSGTFGAGAGGTITAKVTEGMNLSGQGSFLATAQGLGADAGNAGNILVEAKNVSLSGGSQFSSATIGPGQGGSVTVRTTDFVHLAGEGPGGQGTGFFASTESTAPNAGNAGSILVETPRLTILDGPEILSVTRGPGRGGQIHVDASDILIRGRSLDNFKGSGLLASSFGTEAGAGDAGSIVVNANNLTLQDGAVIATDTFGPGRGGNITVKAMGDVTMSGTGLFNPTGSGIFATSATTQPGAGNAGNILVEGNTVTVEEGAQIASGTVGTGQGGSVTVKAMGSVNIAGFSPDGIWVSALLASAFGTGPGSGNGGDVTVEAARITVDQGAVVASFSEGSGRAGNIVMRATDRIDLVGDSVVIVAAQGLTEGAGNAGSINIETGTLRVADGTQIVSGTFGPGQGGSVAINASEGVTITGVGNSGFASGLLASAEGKGPQAGHAGDIVITTKDLSLNDGGVIESSTSGPGNAGNITLNVDTLRSNADLDGAPLPGRRVSISSSSTLDEFRETDLGISAGRAGAITIRGLNGATNPTDPTTTIALDSTDITTSIAGGTNTTVPAKIEITARTVTQSNGAELRADTFGEAPAGDIVITAKENLSILNSLLSSETFGSGDAGTVSIDSKSFTVLGGEISTRTSGAGDGGQVAIHAAEDFRLEIGVIETISQGFEPGAGKAGDVSITAGNFVLDRARIATSTHGPGQGGNLTLTAVEDVSLASGGLFAMAEGTQPLSGDAGNILVTARNVTLTDGARFSSKTDGPGKGGSVTVLASGTVSLIGDPTIAGDPANTGFHAGAEGSEPGAGSAGEILVGASEIIMTQGARVDANTIGPGSGGHVTLRGANGPQGNVKSVFIDGTGSGVFTTTEGTGAGGNINVQAVRMTMDNGATVSAASSSTGDAGTITINAGTEFLSTNSSITTESLKASGGNITLLATDMVHLKNSQITASVFGGPKTAGGNILIDPNFIILQNSQIIAQAIQGAGGNINLAFNQALVTDARSTISASSEFGVSGTVNINSPTQNLSGALVPLEQNFLSGSTLSNQRCAARMAEGQISTFIVTEHEGLPQEPGGMLLSGLVETDGTAASETFEPIRVASGSQPPFTPLTPEPVQLMWSHDTCRR